MPEQQDPAVDFPEPAALPDAAPAAAAAHPVGEALPQPSGDAASGAADPPDSAPAGQTDPAAVDAPADPTVAAEAAVSASEALAMGSTEAPTDAPADVAADAPADAPVPAPADPVVHLSPADCAARLAALFPALFGRPQPVPLKLRIQADVQQRAPGVFTKKSLSGFLQRYTTGTAYLKALVAGQERHDLDGLPAGVVADEHREAAVTELARRRALHDERRATERQAQRQAQEQSRQAWQADQQARQGRAALLRAFETTTLTRANFCALKQIPEAGLDEVLAQARVERQQEPPPAAAQRPPQRAGDQRPDGDRRPQGDRRPPGERRPEGDRKFPPRRPGSRPPPGR